MATIFVLEFLSTFSRLPLLLSHFLHLLPRPSLDRKSWSGMEVIIGVNLQSSFLTPPFGFALFYLRGVAPPQVTTGHISRGAIPFILLQMLVMLLIIVFPQLVTALPHLVA